MNVDELRKFCLSMPHATEDVKWSSDLTFLIGGKMFAVTNLDAANLAVSFKCTTEKFAELTERDGVRPADYVARYHWVTVEKMDAVKPAELKDLIKNSYEMVRDKLPKKFRWELGV
ncbi:MAG TPA: MmcQ/YjbR family DNA-binding protein [Pyrinomonadaceae bacterium]|jgi:predicted DNA-binding protein (MmcQ/YjbR family)